VWTRWRSVMDAGVSQFRLFTKESIGRCQQQALAAAELAKQKVAKDDDKDDDKPQPNPSLEAGKPLPKNYQSLEKNYPSLENYWSLEASKPQSQKTTKALRRTTRALSHPSLENYRSLESSKPLPKNHQSLEINYPNLEPLRWQAATKELRRLSTRTLRQTNRRTRRILCRQERTIYEVDFSPFRVTFFAHCYCEFL